MGGGRGGGGPKGENVRAVAFGISNVRVIISLPGRGGGGSWAPSHLSYTPQSIRFPAGEPDDYWLYYTCINSAESGEELEISQKGSAGRQHDRSSLEWAKRQ